MLTSRKYYQHGQWTQFQNGVVVGVTGIQTSVVQCNKLKEHHVGKEWCMLDCHENK
jgi:hypothetical protein